MPHFHINPAKLGYTEHYGRLISSAIRVPGLTLETFLAQGRGMERFLWQTAEQTHAGIGVVTELTAWGADRFQHIQQQATLLFQDWLGDPHVDPIAKPCLFGGFSFQDDFVPDNTWSIYAPAIFVLPHYQFAQYGNSDPWLILNVTIAADEDDQDLTRVRADLHDALASRVRVLFADAKIDASQSDPPTPVQVLQINYPMSYESWQAAIEHAADAI